jgi:pimeloyl-ACP methyl ester carboxylesterase
MKTATAPLLAFDDVGDGEPALLMLPGWAVNRTLFRPLLPLLGAHRRVVSLDWRGHGGSADPDGDFRTEELVDDAVAVLDAAGIERVVPVAQSHGGWMAIGLRRRLGPDRVPGLVLCSWMVLGAPPPFFDALENLQHPDRWEDERDGLLERWLAGNNDPELVRHSHEMAAYPFEMWARAGREIAASCRAEGTPLQALANLEHPTPTLHLYAQPADPAYLDAQREQTAEHDWFHVRRVDAMTHFPMLEHPHTVAQVIEDFTRKLDG